MTHGMKWDTRFMEAAALISGWSKDPSTKVGCVIVNPDRHIVATGYNGFPRGTSDAEAIYEDRARKYLCVVHAEANAVTQAVASLKGCTAYVTHPPCSQCMALMIQAGITRVVSRPPGQAMAERFLDSFTEAARMAREAGVITDFNFPG